MLKDLTRERLETLRPAAGKDMKIKSISGQIKRTLLSDGTLEDGGGLVKCPGGKHFVTRKQLLDASYVCPICCHYFRLSPSERLEITVDAGSFEAWDSHFTSGDPLSFADYRDSIAAAVEATGANEAVVTGAATIEGHPTAIAVMDPGFLLGTMGTVVGEKITRAIEEAGIRKLPIVIFTSSGGARMQEGIFSLMQMAKTSAAMQKHADRGLASFIVLTDPTFGGVTASFGMLGDVILAEKGARIGFAGPRVIKQTIAQDLPPGFQEADFIEEHGFCDRTVAREKIRPMLARLIDLHSREV